MNTVLILKKSFVVVMCGYSGLSHGLLCADTWKKAGMEGRHLSCESSSHMCCVSIGSGWIFPKTNDRGVMSMFRSGEVDGYECHIVFLTFFVGILPSSSM